MYVSNYILAYVPDGCQQNIDTNLYLISILVPSRKTRLVFVYIIYIIVFKRNYINKLVNSYSIFPFCIRTVMCVHFTILL